MGQHIYFQHNTFILWLMYQKILRHHKKILNIFKKFIEDILSKNDVVTVDSLKFINNNTICTVSECLTDKYNIKCQI